MAAAVDERLLRAHVASELKEARRVPGPKTFASVPALVVERDVVAGALSSAAVHLGDSAAVCSVSGSAAPVDPEDPAAGVLDVVVSTAQFCDAANVPRDDIQSRAKLVAKFVRDALLQSDAIDLAALVIVEGSVCWQLRVDVRLIELASAPYDVALCAAVAALRTVSIPSGVLPDGTETAARQLTLRARPVALTCALVRHGELLASPSQQELLAADATLTVTIDAASGGVVGVHHRGGYPCSREVMSRAMEWAGSFAAAADL